MWHHAVLWTGSDVLEVPAASVFRLPLNQTTLRHFHRSLISQPFVICCSYPPPCQVLLLGRSLATDAVNLIYEYHRTLALLPCVVKQFPYQPVTTEQCVVKGRPERPHQQVKTDGQKLMVPYGMRCSPWCCWRFQCSGMWHCVVGWEVSDISRDCSAFFFRVIQSRKSTWWTVRPWRLRLYGPSYNKSQQDAIILKFILIKYSTCFGYIYCPSSGVPQHCIHRNRYLSC